MKRIFAFLLCVILIFSVITTASAADNESGTIKILAIGNSFTQNSVSLLRRFSDGDISAKTDLLVASLTIGGSSLETHAKNIKENASKYTYSKYYTQNEKKENITIQQAVTFEEWDYIVLQQVSQLSGMEETYEPYLGDILKYIKGVAPNTKIVLNQTWAYESDSKHSGYANYNNSQAQMFIKLKSAYSKYATKYSLDVIPCGEAFELARADDLFDYKNGGLSLCNDDGYHANTAGCYLLGAVWYEYFSKKSVWDNVYTNNKLTKGQMATLKRSAHDTIKKYYTVSGSNTDTYGFLTEAVSSEKTEASSNGLVTATTSRPISSQNTATTSVVTSVQSVQSILSQDTLNSNIEASEPSNIPTAVPVPKKNFLPVILLTVGISVLAVGSAVVLVIFFTTKKKQ